MKKAFLIFFLIIFFLILNNTFLKMFVADIYYTSAKDLTKRGEYDEALKDINFAISYNKSEPSYFREKAKIFLVIAQTEDFEKNKSKENALNALVRAHILNTINLTTIRNSISLYYFLAADDENFLQITKNYYNDLKTRYPNDLGIFVEIAKYEKRLNLMDDFNSTIVVINNLRPDILTWNEDLK